MLTVNIEKYNYVNKNNLKPVTPKRDSKFNQVEVKFQTKEESNNQQHKEFLSLTEAERFFRFLELSRAINRIMPVKDKLSFEERYKDNFLLIHKKLKDDEVG